MPVRPCPRCQAPTVRWLEETSKNAVASYYRCDRCGHVWTYPKGQELTAEPRHVTPLPDEPLPRKPEPSSGSGDLTTS